MAATGIVLRIEKSSIFDGDGLRTVLFLKGCPLRCLWCSTPESRLSQPERGLSREKCTGCGKCLTVCEKGALSLTNGSIAFDSTKCAGCFRCVAACPNRAIEPYGIRMSSEAAVKELAKDSVFYFHSGGGVTVSGGEPLDQSDFVREVLAGCSELGINCALESCFYSQWNNVEKLLPYLSLLHVDIKHPNNEKHRELTGVGNELIMENLRRADESEHSFDLVTRTPLVPGLNDSDEAIEELADKVKNLKKLRFMEFLAYHRLGVETYKRLGFSYPIENIKTPSESHMLRKATLFKKLSGVRVKINGKEV